MSSHLTDDKGIRFNAARVSAEYLERRHIYDALANEAVFILRERIADAGIKIHLVEHRVKETTSVIEKGRRKELADPLNELTDLVGCRVICLFRSDIEKIGQIIKNSFDVVTLDDKISENPDAFGYMSVHYIVKMRDFTGPRYDKIRNLLFEIQVRTISMHAWAAISHHLDYKGDWDVPAHLKKALNALSGLFYVADDTFERFFAESQESKKRALQNPVSVGRSDINLDTLGAYLATKFPDRKHSEEKYVSELVQELKDAGYTTIQQVDKDIDATKDAVAHFEATYTSKRSFADVGVVRLSLSIASEAFFALREQKRYGSRPIPKEPDEYARRIEAARSICRRNQNS